MKKILGILIGTFFLLNLAAQNINKRFERWQISDKPANITGVDISPDGNTLALVCGKKQPLFLYNLSSRSIIDEIDVKSENMGYNVAYSSKGNYLLLQEKKIETSFKKAKKADYSVVDINSKKVIHHFVKINDAKISADEKQIVTLENGTVNFRDIKTGKLIKQFTPEDACNALAISEDGKSIALVIKPNKKEVSAAPSVRDNKKAIKKTAKLKHMIAIYDTESFDQIKLVPEIYDNINLLYYMNNDKKLLSFNMAVNSYVNVVDASNNQPTRESYLSRTSMQPEFEYSKNEEFFGISTVDAWPAVNVYKVDGGAIVDSYNTQMKIWKNIKKKIYPGTNTSFTFMPNNREILIAYGNSLILWKFDKDEE